MTPPDERAAFSAPEPARREDAPALEPAIARQVEALAEAAAAALAPHESGGSRRANLVEEMMRTALRTLSDSVDLGQLKVMERALREMRSGYRVFNRYKGVRKISIFGSARTPEDHPDYRAASEFGALMAAEGWMAITGAGLGIMKAGHEGPQREASFGLSIRLPFETNANEIIKGDPKLVNFRYFFTRKLMFVSHSDAVACFPGGFGTMDELFETLTLIQTGKTHPLPVVLVEGAGPDGKPRGYWRRWEKGVVENLIEAGWISHEDTSLYEIAESPADAVARIVRFYHRYHSSRYVGDTFVVRVKRPLSPRQLEQINDEFSHLVKSGSVTQHLTPLEGEDDHVHLPRVAFHHTKRGFGHVRRFIDRMNEMPDEAGA
ncbi:MAG: LOG family protein [Phycisphaerales bacterium]